MCLAIITLSACQIGKSEEEIIEEKHEYYMNTSVSYQKGFQYKLDVLGKNRTAEDVFEAMKESVELTEKIEKSWNGE
jgi:hypothetical protein